MAQLIDRHLVLSMLNKLLEQAQDVEVCVGKLPSAQEALMWAISEVTAVPLANNLPEPRFLKSLQLVRQKVQA